MKKFNYDEILELHKKIGGVDWAYSRMSGRLGISHKRLDKAIELRPDLPIDYIRHPEKYKKSQKSKP